MRGIPDGLETWSIRDRKRSVHEPQVMGVSLGWVKSRNVVNLWIELSQTILASDACDISLLSFLGNSIKWIKGVYIIKLFVMNSYCYLTLSSLFGADCASQLMLLVLANMTTIIWWQCQVQGFVGSLHTATLFLLYLFLSNLITNAYCLSVDAGMRLNTNSLLKKALQDFVFIWYRLAGVIFVKRIAAAYEYIYLVSYQCLKIICLHLFSNITKTLLWRGIETNL